ncbi:MAG: T9SS type A sorting domain-containing protein, partial [Ignavibacteriota bacterium]
THGAGDFWVFKLDISGKVIWSKTYGGSKSEWAYCVRQTSDGGYVVCGDITSDDGDVTGFQHGDWDAWVIKLSNAGDLQWEKTFGGAAREEAYDIRETSDGGFIFTGSTLSDNGDVTGHRGAVNVSDFWVVKLIVPADPFALGFQSIPSIPSCLTAIDSLHIIFPSRGHYEIRSISFSGNDGSSFVSTVATPLSVSATDSFEVPIPVRFSPNSSSGQVNYQAVANIVIHSDLTNKDYSFAIPVSANAIGNLSMNVTAHLQNPSARVGDEVYLQIGYAIDISKISVPLSGLGVQSIRLVFDYNTDLLDLRPNEITSWFEGQMGWTLNSKNTSVDETKKQLTLTLSGKTPLISPTGILGQVVFKATLPPLDTTTSFSVSSCRIFNSFGDEMLQPCISLNVISDSSFTLLPQCGDSLVKLVLRNEVFAPFRIMSLSPNPVAGGLLNLQYLSRIDGLVSLGVYNVSGLEVKRVLSGEQVIPGEHNISIDLSSIPSGLYWYKFDFNGTRELGRFVIAR